MANYFGIDHGASGLKIAQVDASYRGVVFKNYPAITAPSHAAPAVADTTAPAQATAPENTSEITGSASENVLQSEPPAMAALSQTMELAAANGRFRNSLAAAALPSGSVSIHILNLPFKDFRRIEQTLPFELENHIPFDLDGTVYDYAIAPASGGGARVTAALAAKNDVTSHIGVFNQHGVPVRYLVAPGLVYSHLLSYLHEQELRRSRGENAGRKKGEPVVPTAYEGTVAVLDLGDGRSSLTVFKKMSPVFNHVLSFSGRQIRAGVAQEFAISDAEASNVIKEAAFVPTDGITEMSLGQRRLAGAIESQVRGLIREIRICLRNPAVAAAGGLEHVFLAGGVARIRHLAPYLQQALGVPVALLLPPVPEIADGGEDVTAPGPEYALAAALALSLHSTRLPLFNFRKGALAFKGDFAAMRKVAWRIGAGVASIVLALAFNAYAQLSVKTESETKLTEQLCSVSQALLGQCFEDPNLVLSMLKKPSGANGLKAIPKYTALDYLAEFSQRVPEGVKIEMREIDINLDKIRFEGETNSFDAIDKFAAELKKFDCFADVNKGRTRKETSSERINFELSIKSVCN